MARGIEMKDWETPEALAKLKSWSKCSKTEIARRIGISRATLDRWAAKSTKINNALVQGDVQHCNEVEDSLYTSCHDRMVIEVAEKQLIGKDGKPMMDDDGKPVTVKEVKQRWIAGDPRAQQYYLERRNPNRWPEAVKVEDDEAGKDEVIGFIPAPDVMEEPAQEREGV